MGLSRATKTADDCFRHAIKRARERYDRYFTREDLVEMSAKIQNSDAVFLLRESQARTHWLLDDQFIVVYNRGLKAIVTFLPPESIYNYLPVSS